MMQSLSDALQTASAGPLALPLAFLLGLVSALASFCCTLPAMGMLVAYSGTRGDANRRTALLSAGSFLVGTSLALMVLGAVAGFAGQTAQAHLGQYWKLFAGIMAVTLGIFSLKLIPVTWPSFACASETSSVRAGMLGSVLTGLLMGGGVAACSLPCNPGIFLVLGVAVMQGQACWGMLLMALFAMGFSLPLAAILMGVSMGKASLHAQKAEALIRTVSGVLLTGVGLYLLATF